MERKILLAATLNDPSAARLAGALSALGAHVEAVFPRHHVLRFCRYIDRGYRYRPLKPQESFAEALRVSKPDRVIPCDDRALQVLLSLPEFTPLLTRSFGPLENYITLTARTPSIAAARQEGISAPLTLTVPDFAALPEALKQVGLPCVMKTDGSCGGEGVKLVANRSEAERAFKKFKGARWRSLARMVWHQDLHYFVEAKEPKPVVINVQAFVPGKPASTVFVARQGKVIANLHMDVVTWSGDTGPAAVVARTRSFLMDEAAHKIAARFRLDGLHGLNFVRDEEGMPHLVAINPRATPACHLAWGTDLPAALLGVHARPSVTSSPKVALFPQFLAHQERPGVYRDIPWDDPAMLRAAAGHALPEATELELIPEFARPIGGPPIIRRPAV